MSWIDVPSYPFSQMSRAAVSRISRWRSFESGGTALRSALGARVTGPPGGFASGFHPAAMSRTYRAAGSIVARLRLSRSGGSRLPVRREERDGRREHRDGDESRADGRASVDESHEEGAEPIEPPGH